MKNKRFVLLIALASVGANATGQSREGARSILENARSLCVFVEGGPGWTVTCPPDTLPRGRRLQFAESIANADAYLTGEPRHISFLIRGKGMFAVADPQRGIREVASTASPVTPGKSKKVVLGTTADDVLEWRGKAISSTPVGQDDRGLLVEWRYPDVTYLMARRTQNGIEAYRVSKITSTHRK